MVRTERSEVNPPAARFAPSEARFLSPATETKKYTPRGGIFLLLSAYEPQSAC